MKKEFKAPTLETKVLSTENSIMDAMLLSANVGKTGLKEVTVTVDDYKQWKSNN